jgi:hypothetical protein
MFDYFYDVFIATHNLLQEEKFFTHLRNNHFYNYYNYH